MFDTPQPSLEIQQFFSCAREIGQKKPPADYEVLVTVRGRRRTEGRTKESELFETTYCVDVSRLAALRKGKG